MAPLDLTALESELSRNESVDDSASALITALLADVEANKDTPAKVQAVVDRWRASTDKLAAAVEAGTPSAPPVDPPSEAGKRR